MADKQPVDWEATAASVLNGAMIAAIGLLALSFGLFRVVEKIGDPRMLFRLDWVGAGAAFGAMSIALFGGRAAWFALKQIRNLPTRVRTPSVEEGQLSRQELILQAPWVDRLPRPLRLWPTIATVIGVAAFSGLIALTWRLPEPLRSQIGFAFLALVLAIRLAEWAWRRFQKAR